jgi:integrase
LYVCQKISLVDCTEFRRNRRLGEALALDYDDINFASGYIAVRKSFKNGVVSSTKTGKSRQVDMSSELIVCMRRVRSAATVEAIGKGFSVPDGPIFTSISGDRLSQNTARGIWGRCLRSAGIEYRQIHATRHTFASYLLAGGADLFYVSKMLGHSNISMTSDVYGHMVPDSNRATMDIIDGQLGQAKRSTQTKKAL